MALLLIGPLSQFLTQGYLRELLNGKGAAGAGPRGTSMVHVYTLICMVALCLAATTSIVSWADAAIVAIMVAISALSRMQEAWLVATRHQNLAVLLFYVLPPLVLSALILAVHASGEVNDFWSVALSQIVAYGGCLVASVLLAAGAAGRRLLLPVIARGVVEWRREFAAVRHFLASGALLSTTEQVPIVILNTFGLGAVIPSFELARKVSAVPQVFIHALNMHMMPDLIRYVAANAWDRFRTVLGRFILVSGGIGCLYVAVVIVGLLTLQRFSGVGQSLDMPVFVILLAAAAVTAIGAPIGSALVALNGEIWWTLAASISLAVQLLVSFLGLEAWGAEAIALSMLAQAVVLRAIVTFGTALLFANRETQDAAFQGAS
jgi:O-antigen/teichoic acid export membrane protein